MKWLFMLILLLPDLIQTSGAAAHDSMIAKAECVKVQPWEAPAAPSRKLFHIHRAVRSNKHIRHAAMINLTRSLPHQWIIRLAGSDGNEVEYIIVPRPKPQTYQTDLQYLPVNKQKYNELIAAAAERHQISEKLLHAIIQAESAYNANAVSSAGAAGLMQLMPDTAQRYDVANRLDVRQNLDGGAHYLKDLLVMFNADLKLAVAGYNAGEDAVLKYNYTVPPYPETRDYVRQVLTSYGKR